LATACVLLLKDV